MNESVLSWSNRRPVAFALAGVLLSTSIQPLPAVAIPGEIAGRAEVIDGDTLDIDGTHIRLEGIDAPELAQTCARSFIGSWRCGEAAARELERLTAGRSLTCRSRGADKYGRLLGVCAVDGLDINAEMVRRGLAWAFVKYSKSYVAVEEAARAAKAGIWQAHSEPAWVFREKRWADAETEAPDGCAIKGNITGHGRIYHAPWSVWYGRVRVESAKGERWFCSEAEALAAGWRPALTH